MFVFKVYVRYYKDWVKKYTGFSIRVFNKDLVRQ